jgi:hypothetical protein
MLLVIDMVIMKLVVKNCVMHSSTVIFHTNLLTIIRTSCHIDTSTRATRYTKVQSFYEAVTILMHSAAGY